MRGFVTSPLERAIATADGIDYMESQSSLGLSTIKVRLNLNYDATKALAEISSKVDQVRRDLPPEAEVPVINIESADSQFASAYLVFSKGSRRVSALAGADGAYNLEIPGGTVAELIRAPLDLRIQAQRKGWRIRLADGAPELLLELRILVDSTGTARLNPADHDVPEIGDELAVARALSHLADKLLHVAADDIEAITHEFLRAPRTIQIGRRANPAETVTQFVYEVDPHLKPALLAHLLHQPNFNMVLVFSRMKHGADRLARAALPNGVPVISAILLLTS